MNGPADEDHDRDWDDTDIQMETGVFWFYYSYFRGRRNGTLSRRLSQIYDGTSNTIMMTENLKAGESSDFFYAGSLTSWANPFSSNCGFIYNLDPRSGPSDFDEPQANERYPSHIYSQRHGPERSPYPSFNHPSGVNISTCDGAVRFLSQDIDAGVYARLMSPGGCRLRAIPGFEAQQPLGSTW